MIAANILFNLIACCYIAACVEIEIPDKCSVRNGDLVLGGSVFQNKVESSRIGCAIQCQADTACDSFNYHSSTGDCQLNNATVFSDCSNVQPSVGYKHYEIVSTLNPFLTFPMLRLLLSKAQGRKDLFLKTIHTLSCWYSLDSSC